MSLFFGRAVGVIIAVADNARPLSHSLSVWTAMKQSLLIEIGCEDLPARYVLPLAEALRAGMVNGFAKRGIAQGEAKLFATPRRIAVQIAEVAGEQPTQTIDLTGPALNVALKDGTPTPAALGFAKKCGVEFAALGQKDGKLHFAKTEPGKPTVELIPGIFEEMLKGMDELVPKRMRWGSSEETFVRPVQWLLALLGDTVVPLTRWGLRSGRLTYGHRFHAPAVLVLAQPGDYEAVLKDAYVWAEVASRKAEIERQIKAEVARFKGHARINPELLDEVTALVEWPVVITGRMEQRFMELPPEVIVATVETNQRYFTVFEDASFTKLKPVFITIANIESRDVAQVIEGNERVVRPRLSDAMFFWEQDKKLPFVAYGEKLKALTFQKELGSVAAKADRVATLAESIAFRLPDALRRPDRTPLAREAALLCKNDLVTRMVYEFPELQGLMGGYYARESGFEAEIATAISEHYLPTQQGTPVPSTLEGKIVALADKLDTLAQIFVYVQKPTASKDPFALRRAALGILRICIEGKLPLDTSDLLYLALGAQDTKKHDDEVIRQELNNFVAERLRAYLVDSIRYDLAVTPEAFEAVNVLGITVPTDFTARLDALLAFMRLDAAKNLSAAHKRIRNILKQAGDVGTGIDPARFEHDSEHALFAAMKTLDLEGDYTQQLTQLATLREPVDAFFTGVMVNADDPAVRANRLSLLGKLDKLCRSVADISQLPG